MSTKISRPFVVVQERQVRVNASGLTEAATKADAMFRDPSESLEGGRVRETDLTIREDY